MEAFETRFKFKNSPQISGFIGRARFSLFPPLLLNLQERTCRTRKSSCRTRLVWTATIAAGDILKLLSSICKCFLMFLVKIKLEKAESESEISQMGWGGWGVGVGGWRLYEVRFLFDRSIDVCADWRLVRFSNCSLH